MIWNSRESTNLSFLSFPLLSPSHGNNKRSEGEKGTKCQCGQCFSIKSGMYKCEHICGFFTEISSCFWAESVNKTFESLDNSIHMETETT